MKRSLLLFSGLLATGVVLAQTATPPPSNAQRDEMRQRWHERSEAKFGEADSNHDGNISQSEWQSARLKEANEHFQRLDTDRNGKLSKTEMEAGRGQRMQGGCFSISSLGGIGGTAFTPIINAPEVAILGVSKSDMSAESH